MEWKDAYSLGVEKIDRQHKELFQAVNRIVRIVDEGDAARNGRACAEAIKYLETYTLQHFEDEEAYQLAISYEGYWRHKKIHDAFRAELPILEHRLEASSYSRESVLDFVQVLTAWLVNHIMKEDQQIAGGSAE